jgi:SAM-dependent methyltransferase
VQRESVVDLESDRARREREHFDQLAGKQGEAWWGHLGPAGRARARRRAALVVAHAALRPGDRVLEIGCGGGFFTSQLVAALASGVNVTSVDISPELVERARSRPELAGRTHLVIEVGNVESLPYADASFDAVVGSSILHHLDLDRALPALARVLKPGGRFVFAEPNAFNPLIALERRFGIGYRAEQVSEDESAINRFKMARRLAEAGFAVDGITPFDFLHPLTPRFLHAIVSQAGRVCETVPILREIAGSALIAARKPPRSADTARP